MITTRRRPDCSLRHVVYTACALLVFASFADDCVGQFSPTNEPTYSAETLPTPRSVEFDDIAPEDCQPIPPDPPVWALTADIRPRSLTNESDVETNLPPDCARGKFGGGEAIILPMNCTSCELGHDVILAPAQFCHRPLYFSDEPLERYGVRWCRCQPVGSAALFVRDTLTLPIKMVQQRPCSCEPTPPYSPCY